MSLLNYKSEVPQSKIDAAYEIERNRQELMRGEATDGALAYARFLSACENDATINSSEGFKPSDDVVIRNWPFLESLIRSNNQGDRCE